MESIHLNYNVNEKNGMWKGDKVGYYPLHRWIEKRKSKPLWCEKCFSREPYDLANISGQYKRDINDFKWLCRKCHMEEDGRINNLKSPFIKGNIPWNKDLTIETSEKLKSISKNISISLKGRIPWNKNLKGYEYKKHFKKGIIPWNKRRIEND